MINRRRKSYAVIAIGLGDKLWSHRKYDSPTKDTVDANVAGYSNVSEHLHAFFD